MFEAHSLKADLFEPIQGFHNTTPSLKCIIHNHTHDCPVWAWTALGKSKFFEQDIQTITFLYIEYRDTSNLSRYSCCELDQHSISSEHAHTFIESLTLTDIDATKTKAWLSKGSI